MSAAELAVSVAKRSRAATNTKRWNSDEETLLIASLDAARKTHKGASVWTEVARLMGDDRTDSALQQHWYARSSSPLRRASPVAADRTLGPPPADCNPVLGVTHITLCDSRLCGRQIMNGRRKRSGERMREASNDMLNGFDARKRMAVEAPQMTHEIQVGLGAPLVIEDLD